MTLTLELLNHMAANHPEEIALAERELAITFSQLIRLVHKLSRELFDNGMNAYGQHTENEISRGIVTLCADCSAIHPFVTIPTSISNEGLSATLKAARLQVIYTDLMDKLWETANVFGPFISKVTPIDFCQRKIWKVTFRSEQNGKRIDEEEIKGRWQWQGIAASPASHATFKQIYEIIQT
jgi:hypothetical protein